MGDELSCPDGSLRDIIFIMMNMIKQTESNGVHDQQVRLLRLLAHPARLAVLQILRFDEECVCHMEAILGLRQAYLSQQLAVLREAGLIADRRDGWNIYYRLADPRLIPLLDALASSTGSAPAAETRRRVGETCPCPKCSPNGDAGAK